MSSVTNQTPFIFNPDGKLKVESEATIVTGDIEIGAVEMKDATTDTRVKIKSDGVDNAMVTTSNFQDILAKYRISDVDDDASPNYYGNVDKEGGWFLLKETIVAGATTYLYCKGDSNYAIAWGNRATQTYARFDEVF